MKGHRWILVSSLTWVLFTTGLAAQDSIRLTNGEWTPWLAEDLKYYGGASRVVTEAFALEGVTVEYGFFPWKRAYSLGQTGKWDGSVIWIKTPEREKEFVFCDPVLIQQRVFYHLKDFEFEWETIEDLKGLTIGGTLEYTYGAEFDNAEKAKILKVKRVPNDVINFRKLLKGKIQIFPMEPDVAAGLLKKNFTPEDISTLTFHPQPLARKAYHLILSKKYPHAANMCDVFHRGLTRLKANGKYNQYLTEAHEGLYNQE